MSRAGPVFAPTSTAPAARSTASRRQLERFAGHHGRPVTIIGHSRGGTMARILAVRRPDLVHGIVCLGSPLTDQFAVHPLVRAQVEAVATLGTLGLHGLFRRDCLAGRLLRSGARARPWRRSRSETASPRSTRAATASSTGGPAWTGRRATSRCARATAGWPSTARCTPRSGARSRPRSSLAHPRSPVRAVRAAGRAGGLRKFGSPRRARPSRWTEPNLGLRSSVRGAARSCRACGAARAPRRPRGHPAADRWRRSGPRSVPRRRAAAISLSTSWLEASPLPLFWVPSSCALAKRDDRLDPLRRDAEVVGELDVLGAEQVDEGVDALGRRGGEILAQPRPVGDGVAPCAVSHSALAGGGDAEHACAAEGQQLRDHRADAAGGRRHADRLAGAADATADTAAHAVQPTT